ncbi:hypothetical protein KH5_05610 [Urechidicola sp. KH5]
MKKIGVLIALFITIFACEKKQITTEIIEVSADELIELAAEVQLIDVRTEEEYEGGYILDAENINFTSDDFKDEMNRLDKKTPVLVYCMAGGRSTKATAVLEKLGFEKVFNYTGGYGEWSEQGREITNKE